MGTLCGLFGKSRQAYYDHQKAIAAISMEQALILQEVTTIRTKMPRIGTRKLYHLLHPLLAAHGIKIGRDKLFDLLSEHELLVRKRRRRFITTDSNHPYRKYHNLIKELVPTAPEQLWVSDITYIRLLNGFCYLSLITDAYSKKIVGYYVSKDLGSYGALQALQMALGTWKQSQQRLIHHSDRGVQYCCYEYVEMLTDKGIYISMTEKSDPYENAIAERVNGILKTELQANTVYKNYEEACCKIAAGIEIYNTLRPHASCNYLTPQQAHDSKEPLSKKWKKYPYKKQYNEPVQ